MSYKTKKILKRVVLVLGLAAGMPAQAASTLGPQELMGLLGIGPQEQASLDKGQTVSFEVAEGDEKELGAGLVIYLPATPAKIVQVLNKKGLSGIDADVTAQGQISVQMTADSFKGFAFKAGDDEAGDFLQASPGSQFNLSTEEFQSLKNSADASQAYRKILADRVQAYRKSGLKAIAPYDRGNGTEANPAGELRAATQESKVLAKYFPELYKAWLNYPAALPASTDEKFFWLNRRVEGRPTAILAHSVMMTSESGAVILARQFYVGHSYNSNQLTIACLPYQDGSLVFYANRSFTDQVAGMGSGLKHSIGREQLKGEIIKRLGNLKKALK